ncbi:MAG: hypothetical protein K0S47_3644 [Herbinix sp.]|jgi:hypothetical protein|nr:hypothetical protein [Herbinix sp.]
MYNTGTLGFEISLQIGQVVPSIVVVSKVSFPYHYAKILNSFISSYVY